MRDVGGKPVSGATVILTGAGESRYPSLRTDANGGYRFSGLSEGAYHLSAKMAGYADATIGPCSLAAGESKNVDLSLGPSPSSGQKGVPAATPQFFDEPQFTVAGVTEAMNPGGHGSDTILRNAEALTKGTVLLARLPGDYEISHERAVADLEAGRFEQARAEVGTLLEGKSSQNQSRAEITAANRAELHRLLGDIDEKQGSPLEAIHEYQFAAEMDPSEPNLFAWGADLLLHRALEPAIEVFTRGNRLFPRSARMLVGLGVAWYARGSYEQAAQRVCEASDLNANDPAPYLILGKMQSVTATQSENATAKLERFVQLQPENSLANYYFALSLWQRKAGTQADATLMRVQSLLESAVRLDPALADGYLQLGNLYSLRKDILKSISLYQRAIFTNPELEEAHFRLAQAYRQSGEASKARQEQQLYDQQSKKSAGQTQRERREIQQFVFTLRDHSSGPTPQ